MGYNPVKVVIIGGAGFIGTNLCERLYDKQISFSILDLKISRRFPDRSIICDIRDKDALRGCVDGNIVVNLAAVHRDDVIDLGEYETTNVTGTRNVIDICVEKEIERIVFTSSVAVFGFAPVGTDENGAIQPFNEYGRTKWRAEQMLEEWHQGDPDRRALMVVRPTVVFGEGNRGNVFNLLNQIASGRFLMVGDGTNRKSMAYVGNVSAFLDACIHATRKRGTFNYVDTPDTDMNALVCLVRGKLRGKPAVGVRLPRWLGIFIGRLFDAVAKLTGRRFPISAIRVAKFTADSVFGSAKRDLDGFEPPFTLEEGLERTLQAEFISPDLNREIFYTE